MEIRTVFFSTTPLYLQTFPAVRSLRELSFFGALDDEEFFIVEGSGVAGSPGVLLPGDLPPIGLSDCVLH